MVPVILAKEAEAAKTKIQKYKNTKIQKFFVFFFWHGHLVPPRFGCCILVSGSIEIHDIDKIFTGQNDIRQFQITMNDWRSQSMK